jgi:hypothetical protein
MKLTTGVETPQPPWVCIFARLETQLQACQSYSCFSAEVKPMFVRLRSTTQQCALFFAAAIPVAALEWGNAIFAESSGAHQSAAPCLEAILAGMAVVAAMVVIWRDAAVRRAAAIKRLQDTGNMNHHIRNGLQVITYSHLIPQEEQRSQLINEASQRIVTALQEFEAEQQVPHA